MKLVVEYLIGKMTIEKRGLLFQLSKIGIDISRENIQL